MYLRVNSPDYWHEASFTGQKASPTRRHIAGLTFQGTGYPNILVCKANTRSWKLSFILYSRNKYNYSRPMFLSTTAWLHWSRFYTEGKKKGTQSLGTPTLNSVANEYPIICFTEIHGRFSVEKKRKKEMKWKSSVMWSLGPGHLLYHYPGHWPIIGVGVALSITTARAYPEFHVDHAAWQVLTVALERTVVVEVRVSGWPVVQYDTFYCHGAAALVSVELEIPAVTVGTTSTHSHDSLEGHLQCRVVFELVEGTFLKHTIYRDIVTRM